MNNMDRLARKFETSLAASSPAPIVDESRGREDRLHRVRHVATTPCWRAAISCARVRHSRPSYLRLRALPVLDEVTDFVARHDRVYVVEQNRDAQLSA